jgi:hypothetical protein
VDSVGVELGPGGGQRRRAGGQQRMIGQPRQRRDPAIGMQHRPGVRVLHQAGGGRQGAQRVDGGAQHRGEAGEGAPILG